MTEPFTTDVKIRFADVDDARVVYYPQFLDYCHVAFEDWMEAGFDKPYADIVQREKVGFPAVNLNVDYAAPARYGDTLRVRITCTHLGNKSATVRYEMFRVRDDVLCADARVTVACVDMDTFEGQPIPPHFRAFFSAAQS